MHAESWESTREAFEWHEGKTSASLASRVLFSFSSASMDSLKDRFFSITAIFSFSKNHLLFPSSTGYQFRTLARHGDSFSISCSSPSIQLLHYPFTHRSETTFLVAAFFPDLLAFLQYKRTKSARKIQCQFNMF